MARRFLLCILIASFFLCTNSIIYSQKRTKRKSPQVTTSKDISARRVESGKNDSSDYNLLDLLPPGTSEAHYVTRWELIKERFSTVINDIGIDPSQCQRALGVAVSRGFFTQPDRVFLFETDQANEILRQYQENTQTASRILNFDLANGFPVSMTVVRGNILLVGTKTAFDAVYKVAARQGVNIIKARPELAPLINASRKSYSVTFIMAMPDQKQAAQVIFDLISQAAPVDPFTGSFNFITDGLMDNLTSIEGLSYEWANDDCSFVFRVQYSSARNAQNAAGVLGLAPDISQDPEWKNYKITTQGSQLVTTVTNSSQDCSNPLIAGQLRVKDPASNTSWDIKHVSEESEVRVIPKENYPDGEATLVMRVGRDGNFSSRYAIRGNEENLIEGHEYILRAVLQYKDHIMIDNSPYIRNPFWIPFTSIPAKFYISPLRCEPPSSAYKVRKSITDSGPIKVTKTGNPLPINIDYPLPIVLLHGINACWDSWQPWVAHLSKRTDDATGFMKGYIVFTPSYDYIPSPLASTTAFRKKMATQIASQLNADLKGLFSSLPKLNLICHSNGGVAARALSWEGAIGNTISNVYTLGTPHSGTALPGAQLYDLSLTQMSDFNRKEEYKDFRPSVEVLAISGYPTNVPIVSLPWSQGVNLLYFGISPFEYHDGIVFPQLSTYSIGSYEPRFDFLKFIPLLKFVPTKTFHHREVRYFHMCLGPIAPCFVDNGTPIFDDYIYPHMSQMSTSSFDQQKASSIKAQSSEIEMPAVPKLTEIQLKIAPNETQDIEMPVPLTEQVGVSLAAQASREDLEISFINPDGQNIQLRDGMSYPGLTIDSNYFGEVLVSIKDPVQGDWKIRATTKSKEVTLFVKAVALLNFALVGGTDKQNYTPSEKIMIGARISGDLTGTNLYSVTAKIVDDSRQIVGTTILSEEAGVKYRGYLAAPNKSGAYTVKFEARGTYKNKPFQLQADWGAAVNGARR